MGKVGYWWGEKKSKKFNAAKFEQICQQSGLQLVKLDLNKTLEEQGPFVAIVHKMCDVLIKARHGDTASQQWCQEFHDYVENNPNVVIIDPLPNVEKLMDRYKQYKLIENSKLQREGIAFTPAFVELSTLNEVENLAKMEAASVTFPCVVKPAQAHGSSLSHKVLCLVFNKEGLKDINPPCVAQTFVNHNAILFKLFVVGNQYFIIERPSLKNFYAGDYETIYFDSNYISKPHSSSVLTELDANEQNVPRIYPKKELIDQIVKAITDCFGMTLLGIDIIIDNATGSYAVIDVNVFPGYDEVGNFFQIVVDMILRRTSARERGLPDILGPPKLGNNFPFHSDTEGSDVGPSLLNGETCAESDFPGKCFCCPISDECHNILAKEEPILNQKHIGSELSVLFQNLEANGVKGKTLMTLNENGDSTFLVESAQEDSGIETSDSCDEKKKGNNLRTAKRHSRSYAISSPNDAFKAKTANS